MNTTRAASSFSFILRAVATMGVSSCETSGARSGKCFFVSVAQAGQQEVNRKGSLPVATSCT